MKNTVKKILALVFAVVMVCSLAVPALATSAETLPVYVTVVDRDGNNHKFTVELAEKNMNVEKALKDTTTKVGGKTVTDYVTVNTTSGKVTHLYATTTEGKKLVKVTDDVITGEFGTGSVIVAVNGKAVSEDLATVALEKNDKVTVYWADSTLGTKLAMVDDSRLDEGIVSLYYYDAEGNRQPLKGAKISLLTGKTASGIARDALNKVNPIEEEGKALEVSMQYEFYFTTDEKGQIWIAPDYLDGTNYFTIGYPKANDGTKRVDYDWNTKVDDDTNDIIVKGLADLKKDDGYKEDEIKYAKKNYTRNVEDAEVIGYQITVKDDMYETAEATGDMTMVYVLVAAAAVVTLAAVVVMKKKAVKAN